MAMSQKEWEELVKREEAVSEQQLRRGPPGGGCVAGIVRLIIMFTVFVGLVWVALQILGK